MIIFARKAASAVRLILEMVERTKVSGKRKLVVSNPDKIFYPASHFTKAQVIDYYVKVSPFLLPHFKDRPVTLKRYPDGIHGDFLYEKDAPEFTPIWVKTFPVPRREGGPDIRYILINDVATLAWAANMSSIELHPFLHRAPKIDTPTSIVFDLDPGEGADVLQCAEVAFLLRDLLQQLKLKSFPKVSGSKGIQIYVPVNRAGMTYDITQPFARAVAEMLERAHSDRIVADMSKTLRRDKVFIDWSQNADHKTTVGVYSLRAKRSRPFVSVPVEWNELKMAVRKEDRHLLDFPPDATLVRLKKIGDLFAPVLKLKQKLPEQFVARTRSTSRSRAPKSLAEYEAKRHFDRTAEPAPAAPRRSRQGSRRRFVVQKHAASHLHYDFRLEMHDVLKSWAMPHGLPMARGEVHSAFETEDHPIEYLEFEGIISEGEYGGGTVMVWDIGTYEVVEGNYWKGRLSIFLSGKKLRGEWLLERGEDERGKIKWLMTKADTVKKRLSKRRENISAITGRTIDQIAKEKSAVWGASAPSRAVSGVSPETSPSKARKTPNEKISRRAKQKKTSNAQRSTSNVQRKNTVEAPQFVPPMKATPVEKLPEADEWIYEIKWDGYRAIAIKHGDTVRILSAKNKSLASDFPAVVDVVGKIDVDTAMLDGEVVAVNAEGKPSFQMLQNRASLGRDWQIVYYAFDLLNLNGQDFRRRPLQERKEKLKTLLGHSGVRYSAELHGTADAVVESVKAAGLEGVIAKKRDSIYQATARSASWLKLRLGLSQEFVVGGYNPAPESFQSLLVGYYKDRKLIFAGKVRQGFNGPMRQRLLKTMQPLEMERCPFANLPGSKKGHFGEGVTAEDMEKLQWLKPKLVAHVRFAEWTSYGLLRHAIFLGLRDDKSAREVVKE